MHVAHNQQYFKTMYTVMMRESNFQFQSQCLSQLSPNAT